MAKGQMPTTTATQTTPPSPKRNGNGQWVAGSSGNPLGRPKGKKNEITDLKQDLEIALRQNMSADKIKTIIEAMYDKALEGNVGAAKLILDKVLSNARETEDNHESSGGLKIVIENAQLDVLQNTPNVIDVTPTEVDTHE